MRFALNEEQQIFRDAIRSAFEREAPMSSVRQWAEESRLDAFDQIAVQQGWLGLGVPEEDGGQGGGAIELAIFFEEAGRAAAPTGRLLSILGLAWPLLRQTASGPRLFVQAMVDGKAIAVAVPGACPPEASIDALKVDGDRLHGEISLVLDAPGVDQILVPVRTGEQWQLWWLAAQSDGVEIRPRRLIDHTRRYGDVALSGARAEFLGTINANDMARIGAQLALLIAAESLGLARRMLETTVEYVKQRVQFAVPVGSFQAVKHAAAEALVDIEAMHSGIYYAAWALETGADDGLVHAWIAKSFATEAAVRTSDRSLFLHGAIGYTWEYDLHYFYKRAKSNLELFGAPKLYRERIAAALQL